MKKWLPIFIYLIFSFLLFIKCSATIIVIYPFHAGFMVGTDTRECFAKTYWIDDPENRVPSFLVTQIFTISTARKIHEIGKHTVIVETGTFGVPEFKPNRLIDEFKKRKNINSETSLSSDSTVPCFIQYLQDRDKEVYSNATDIRITHITFYVIGWNSTSNYPICKITFTSRTSQMTLPTIKIDPWPHSTQMGAIFDGAASKALLTRLIDGVDPIIARNVEKYFPKDTTWFDINRSALQPILWSKEDAKSFVEILLKIVIDGDKYFKKYTSEYKPDEPRILPENISTVGYPIEIAYISYNDIEWLEKDDKLK
jgi:hypothetical protein